MQVSVKRGMLVLKFSNVREVFGCGEGRLDRRYGHGGIGGVLLAVEMLR